MCILLNCMIQDAPAAQCNTGTIKRATDYLRCIRWDEIIRSGTITLELKPCRCRADGSGCPPPAAAAAPKCSQWRLERRLRGRHEKHKAWGRRWEKIWVSWRMTERDSVWITMCKHVRGPDLIIPGPPGPVIRYLIKERDKSKRERDSVGGFEKGEERTGYDIEASLSAVLNKGDSDERLTDTPAKTRREHTWCIKYCSVLKQELQLISSQGCKI